MFQDDSAQKQNIPSTATQFFDFSATTALAGNLGTFSRAIVVEAPGYAERRAVHSAFSLAVHLLAVIAFLWFWPLAFPQKPFLFAMSRQFITLPLSPPESSTRSNFSLAPKGLADPFSSIKLTTPIRKFAKPITAVPPPAEILRSSPLQVAGGFGPALAGILKESSQAAAMPALPLDISPDTPIFRAGGEIKVSRLIERVSFDYPEIAKIAHIFGKVVIAAVIDETGKVTQAHLISGPGILGSAAIEELSRERFQPTLLDGQPTKCDLMVRVTFRLAGLEDDAAPW
jgi:protein TonB